MRSYTITTRTSPATNTKGKEVLVRSSDGGKGTFPWDYRYDGPEVHENAARKIAVMENPNQEITMQRLREDGPSGYAFRVIVGRVAQ
jgi:hypothetical protein